MVDGSVLPERPHLVEHGYAALSADPDRRQHIEHGRVGVDDVGTESSGQLGDAACSCRHLAKVDGPRHGHARAGAHLRSIEPEPIDVFEVRHRRTVPRCRQLQCFPPQRPLLAQDGHGPERVAAVQRKRVIKDVQNAHGHQPRFRTIIGPSRLARPIGRRRHSAMKARYFGFIGLFCGIASPR